MNGWSHGACVNFYIAVGIYKYSSNWGEEGKFLALCVARKSLYLTTSVYWILHYLHPVFYSCCSHHHMSQMYVCIWDFYCANLDKRQRSSVHSQRRA